MSIANVKAFFEQVEVDKVLQTKLNALYKRTKTNKDEAGTGVVAIAAGMGFEFTAEDWFQAMEAKTQELPDSMLQTMNLAGDCGEGKNYWCDASWLCSGSTYHD